MKVVVTGATGFVGTPLVTALQARGDDVVVLSRKAGDDLESPGPWTAKLRADAVVHLAGESIAAKRWDARQKQVLRDSRVETTRTIVEAIGALSASERPRVLVCASGADYYDFDDTDDEVTERAPAGDSFLARLCRDWEKEALAAREHGLRVACMRTGIVLGPGGALGKMTTPFKLFVGGRIGSGNQWMPWIHRDDAVAAYVAALDDARYAGPINLVTDSVTNADFAKALGKAMGRPSWLPVPGFALKAAVGELAEYMLRGRRVVPARLRELGFAWLRPTLAEALSEV